MQVRSFLERYPPFDQLPDEELDRVVESVEIAYFPDGATILQEEGEPSAHLYVVRRGAVALFDGSVLIDLLGEGESFGHGSLLSGLGPAFEVRSHEDTLCYLIPRGVAEAILGTRAGLSFLTSSLRRRTEAAARASELGAGDPRHTRLRSLIRREVVAVDASTPIEEAARRMSHERVSSVLVTGRDELGILTDRDLRTKVVGEGHPASAAVGEVASSCWTGASTICRSRPPRGT